MGEYEPNDSRNVTGTAATPDGRWTGQAANDPTRQDQQQAQQGGQAAQQGFAEPFTQQEAAQGAQAGQQQGGGAQSGQQQQGGQSVGQPNEGVSGAANQGNDHTSAIGQNQTAGAAGSGQASYGNSGQGSGQPQQFDSSGQPGGGQQSGSAGDSRFADQLQMHQEVVDSNGKHVGTIDHIEGDRIKLTRQDSADGEHHYLSLSDIAGVEGGKVRLVTSGGNRSGT